MHICLDLTSKIVAIVVDFGTEVAALLAAEVVFIVDGEGPSMGAESGHEDGDKG